VDYLNNLISIANGGRILFGVPVTVIGGPYMPGHDQLQNPPQVQGRLTAVHVRDDGTEEAIGDNLPPKANIGLKTNKRRLPWILRPWSYQQSAAAQITMTAAINSIPALIGLNQQGQIVTAAHLTAIEQNKKAIRHDCNKIIIDAGGIGRGNNNAPSLCLYSGPQARLLTSYRTTYLERGSPEHLLQHDPTGWITTGDCLMRNYWPSFRDAYADVLGNVGTYVVPHHGADDNHSPDFIDAVPGRLAVICARYKSVHHPGLATLDCLHEVDDLIKRVDEYSTYGLREIVLFEDLHRVTPE
jgi:hypothetical protein